MKRACLPTLRTTAILALSVLATTAYSQVVKKSEAIPTEPVKEKPAAAVPAASDVDNDLVVLSPFEVNTAADKGYAATETMASTRLRTDLKDVASSVSVYTPAFLKDVGATDLGTLLQYTTNAEVAGTRGTYAGLGNNATLDDTASLRNPSNNQRVRGLDAADTTRDLFSTDIPLDGYNTDRFEILRGANNLLFGLGSPAGIINTGMRSAEFRNTGSADFRFGSYGSTRETLDANVQIVPKMLAIRIDVMKKNEKFQQDPAFENSKRIYGALRYEPKLFGDSFKTVFKVNFEKGDIDANRPRITPPTDRISPWFAQQNTSSMSGGMIQSGTTKYSVDNVYSIGSAPQNVQPWLTAPVNQQQPAWYMDGGTGQLYSAQGGFIHIGARNNAGAVSNSGMPALRYSSQFYGINGLNGYASNARLPGYQYGQYKDQSLMDPTVFDFYNNLIDGPTKSEFEKWQSYNFDFTQTAFNDRLGLQITVDHQNYNRGGQSLLGWAPTISVDLTTQFQDGTANPNYGRPYILGNSGSGTSYESDRTSGRALLFGELRATDLLEKGFLTKLLGRHRLQGLFSSEELKTDNRSWNNVANSLDWQRFWTGADGSAAPFADRGPMSIIYTGPSLVNSPSAHGANISRIMAPITYPDTGIRVFNSQWNSTADPTATFTTLPTTGWQSLAINPTATTPNIFQASNPANYVGWSSFQNQLQRYNDGENPNLITKASLSKRTTKSYSGIWQAFMWNDAIVPTLGWRYDSVKSQFVTTAYNTFAAHANFATTGSRAYVLPTGPVPLNANGTKMLDYSNQNYRIDNGHSTSGGIVVHLNKLFTRDVLPLNVSVTYNKSQNFQVTDPRNNVFGKPLANPEGKTKEYSILLSTKDRKYSLRIIKYDSYVSNATISGFDMSGIANMPQQGIRFRNVFLYQLSPAYAWTDRETPADRNNWQTAWVDNTTGRPVAAGSVASGSAPANSHLQTAAEAAAMRDASMRAWNQIQADLQAKGFWTAWGVNPVPLSALTDRSTYESTLGPATVQVGNRTILDQTNPQYALTDPNYVQAYSATAPQNLSITSDTQSKGMEYEFTANPTKNWRIQVSASKTEAIRKNVGGPEIDALVNYFDALMTGPAGDMRQFSGGYSATNEVRQNWANWRSKYTAAKIQEGSAVPEIRKWRYVITSNYSFDRGWLKGAGIGASYRWMDKVVIGYPTLVIDSTKATYDLSKPYYGPSEDGMDVWLSYERKISEKLRWKIQLNVRNLLYKNGRIPITVEPDGTTWAGVRIKPTQEWFLTNTLMF